MHSMNNINILSTKYLIILKFVLLFSIFYNNTEACTPQYERELKYLDYYLGIAPANDNGDLNVKEDAIDKYIQQSSDLNCNLQSPPCLWTNAKTDGLLDTSDFYLFDKVNSKPFPFQIQPGNGRPKPGTLFFLAGNVTNDPQGAVLLSAPILCQNSDGILTFEYWLYGKARLEIILLRVNVDRGRLHVVTRLPTNCHFLQSSALCRVELRRTIEPFRIGIRAYQLSDSSIGSFVMLNQLRYNGEVCGSQEPAKLFNGYPFNSWLNQSRFISRTSDLNCEGSTSIFNSKLLLMKNELLNETPGFVNFPLETNVNSERPLMTKCLWAPSSPLAFNKKNKLGYENVIKSVHNHWLIGTNTRLWEKFVKTQTLPIGEFYFQAIDPMANILFLPQLYSEVVPCTQTSSMLSFRFWLSAGVQAQLCTLDATNVELSCVYLNEIDSPGPIFIDINSADRQPFRFSFNVIKISKSTGGIIAINDIKYTGYLCQEDITAAFNERDSFISSQELNTNFLQSDNGGGGSYNRRQYGTSISQNQQNSLSELFKLEAFPFPSYDNQALNSFESLPTDSNNEINETPFSNTLDCDFETDFCLHWLNNNVDNEVENIISLIANQSKNSGAFKKLEFKYGNVPKKPPFAINSSLQGPAAIVVFSKDASQSHVHHSNRFDVLPSKIEYAVLTSQPISCAQNARLIVSYHSGNGALLRICGGVHCVSQKKPYGELSVTITSRKLFHLHILATIAQRLPSRFDYSKRYHNTLPSNRKKRPFRYRYFGNAQWTNWALVEKDSNAQLPPVLPFVIIKQIRSEGGFCRLETPTELSCKILSCNFHEKTFCKYAPMSYTSDDTLFDLTEKGAIASLSTKSNHRAILQSPHLRLSSPADLRFDASLSTYGSRLYICPNDEKIFQQSKNNDKPFANNNIRQLFGATNSKLVSHCELVLGPKVAYHDQIHRIHIRLEATVQQFAFVAIHDAFELFGEAQIIIHSVTLTSVNGDESLC